MFRLHCNKCYRSRNLELEPALVFHMTRCHHILCAGCLDDASKDQKCPLCSLALQTMPIFRNMPSGMANYFEDPTRILQLYRKICKFQCDQRASDNLGLSRQMQQKRDMELQPEGFGKNNQPEPEILRRRMDDAKELSSSQKGRRPCFSSSDNTLSDETGGDSFCLDSNTDTAPQGHHLDKSRTMSTSGDSDADFYL